MIELPTDQPSRRRQWVVFLTCAVPLVALAVWFFHLRDPGPAPVRDTTLERPGWLKPFGPAYRDLPFALGPAEEKAVGAANAIAARATHTHDDGVVFDRDDTRADLERLLADHPGLFHAATLLATWHRRRGNDAEAAGYSAKAEGLAPAVLVQTFRYADGRPLAGATIQRTEVECNRVRNGSLDPSLHLLFTALVTDADGSIRLPVYRTVWRMSSCSHPDGVTPVYPTQGWFEARGKVGLLPVVTVSPKP